MRKYLSTLLLATILVAFGQQVCSQDLNFQAMLDSGKASFKKQRSLEKEDYSQAFQFLSKAVKARPDNAEARYFLACTVDRLNTVDGSQMNNIDKEMVVLASEQLEMVNRLEKRYAGELVLQDPYSKISSIWGSLAQCYLSRNEIDSARWAFSEGKRRGGFLEAVLSFDRQLLNSCAPHAILVTVGDIITIPCWYLQTIERFRQDITIVDANLVNTGWYSKYLKNIQHLSMGFSDTELDTINYLAWPPQQIIIRNPASKSQQFSWLLKPTYYGSYILKGDRILVDILQHNLYRRDFYFSDGTDSTCNLFLDDYLTGDGIVARLRILRNDLTTHSTIVSDNFAHYNMDGLDMADVAKSPDVVNLLNAFRWSFCSTINFLHSKGELAAARRLLHQMKVRFDLMKLPYSSKELERTVDQLSVWLDK